MPSLQEVIERACADGAFEVVIESGHSTVIASPKGRMNTGMPVNEDEIHAMLDRFLSPDQHVELALGQPVSFDLPLRGEKGSWRVVVESLPEGSVVRVTAPARPRSTGEFAASDLRRIATPKGPVVHEAPRSQAAPRSVTSAVNDELDVDLDFDEPSPPAQARAMPTASPRANEAPRRSSPPPAPTNDDVAFDEMQVNEDPPPSLAALGPLDGEEEFRQQFYGGGEKKRDASYLSSSFASADAGASDDGDDWQENSVDEDFSIPGVGPGVGPGLGRPATLDFEDTPVDGLTSKPWADVASDPTPTAGVPAYIPESEGYTPHSGLDVEERGRVAPATRLNPALEFDLAPPAPDLEEEPLDSLLRESTLVIALEEHVAGLVCAGLSTPSVAINDEAYDPRELATRLIRLPRGSCVVLDLEDPSIALGWILRRLEQAFRVILIVRALSMEGAQRMLLGTQSTEAARSWLASHETFGVSYERGALSWRALPWDLDRAHAHIHAA